MESAKLPLLICLWILILPGFSAAQTTILYEDFSSCSLPSGWQSLQNPNSVGWEFGDSAAASSSEFSPISGGGCFAYVNDHKHDNQFGTQNLASEDYLILPPFDFSSGTNSPKLEFDYFYNGDSDLRAQFSSDGIQYFGFWFFPYVDSLGWQHQYIDLSQWQGDSVLYIRFHHTDYNRQARGVAIDNIHVYDPAPNDLRMIGVDGFEYRATGSYLPTFVAQNVGSQQVSNFTAHIQIDNQTPISETMTSTYWNSSYRRKFTFTNPIVFNQPGTYNLKAWTTNPNNSPDNNILNDTATWTVRVVDYLPLKRPLVEEFTGDWCCPCADETFRFNNLLATYPEVHGVANHIGTNDPFELQAGRIPYDAYVFAVPNILLDRHQFYFTSYSPSNDWELLTEDRIAMPEGAEVRFVRKDYDPQTRNLSVRLEAEFYANYPGDYRFNLYIAEDSIIGYQNCATTNPWYHRHTSRAILGGAWGLDDSIPNPAIDGGKYHATFNYTLPSNWSEDQISLIGTVQRFMNDKDHRDILNSVEIGLLDSLVVGVEPSQFTGSWTVYPNPASGATNVQYELASYGDVLFEWYDLSGRKLGETKLIGIDPGPRTAHLVLPESPSGMLILRMNTPEGTGIKKIMVK